MEIHGFAGTDVGMKREHNEDFMLSDPLVGLYVVCDGMGGANAGEVASQMAATTVQRMVREAFGAGQQLSIDRLGAVLRGAIEMACQEVHDTGQADIAKKGMGCTCTAVLVAGTKAVMGHVGDSRLYLQRAGALTQLSEDHTFINEAIKMGIFTPEEAAQCGAHRNVITRCIGKERTVMVDTLVFDIAAGDTLLLCSDGLHGYVKEPAELGPMLAAPDGAAIPARLIALANERGGADNITAVIVRAAAGDDTAAARRSDDVIRSLECLRRIDLMQDLTMAEIVRFKQIFRDITFHPGDVVVREGEVNDNLFVIVQGSAEVVRGAATIATLPAGAHFGEMSLLSNRPRSATVVAHEPCHMLTCGRDALYGFLQQDGMLAAKFFWKLASTLSRRLEDALAQQAVLQQQMQAAPLGAGDFSGRYQRPR